MHYYQVIYDGAFAGIATSENMRKYQPKHGILLSTDEEEAQYLELENGKIFHAMWMRKETVEGLHPTADIREISARCYADYAKAMVDGTDVKVQEQIEEDNSIDNVPVNEDDDGVIQITLDYLKNCKVSEMSNMCSRIIENGFDVVLEDGKPYHFSLNAQDQLNFITLLTMAQSGMEYVPYHADGQLCKYYSVADIMTITNAATVYKTYHTTYYNSLKHYIMAMNSAEEVKGVTYGMPIPDEFQGDVLRQILGGMISETVG